MTTLDEMQARCARTSLRKTQPWSAQTDRQAMAALWLCSEAGEVADAVRRWSLVEGEGDTISLADVRDELGDVLWCLSECATLLGLTLEECAAAQQKKQEARYADVIALHDTEGPA
jgi:NTP pyrophosphatase (non-canonical NTP hydrolase)